MASYYFPHDYSARNDPKLQDVLIEMGVAGIGLYWCIIEQLYEQDNRLPLKSVKNIAFAYHVSQAEVMQLITDFDLFESDGVAFWSKSVEVRMEKRKRISEVRRKSVNTRYKNTSISTDSADFNHTSKTANVDESHFNHTSKTTNVDENTTKVTSKTTNVDGNHFKSTSNVDDLNEESLQMQYKCSENGYKNSTNKINKEINKEREINKEKEAPPPPVISGLLVKAEDLRNDVYRLHGDWVEVFCMNNGIRMTDFRIWMDEFVKMLQNRNERKTMPDFQSHFASWFKIQFDHAKVKRAKTEVYDYAKQEMERQGEEIRKRHDEAKENKITFEEYQELKKRAEAGDAEAKKIIGL